MRSGASLVSHRLPIGRLAIALLLVAAAAGCAGPSARGADGSAGGVAGSPAGSSSAGTPGTLATCVSRGTSAAAHGGLPDLKLACLAGGPAVDIAGLAGPAVVNLWASWCYPCKQEMPLLQQASAQRLGNARFVGVNTNDLKGSALPFLRKVRATYEELSDPTGKLAIDLRAPGLPITVAIDRSGVIVWRKAGQLTSTDIAAAVRAAQTGG